MILLIEHTVGYMLKVLKSGRKIGLYKDEFNSIRHGDYKSFLELVGELIPFMVVYSDGVVRAEQNNPNYECDFEGLLKAGSSLKKFYVDCSTHYGKIHDSDVYDEIYYKVVVFEIAIRMHANNANLLSKTKRIDLKEVIDVVCIHKNLSDDENAKLHNGRRFINMIKHYKNQFPSWKDGIQQFLMAFEILEKNKILIV